MSAERAIGAVDSIWLTMDRPTNLMVIDSVLWCDRPMDWQRLRRVLERRLLQRFPVFTQCAVGGHWQDDPQFSLDRHLVRASLPAPGGDAELRGYVEQQLDRPLDREHPLWQVHLIDGYGSGSAVLTRFHHALADGIALGQVLLSLTDPSPDADLEEESDDPADERAGPASESPGVAERAVRGAAHLVSSLPHLSDLARVADPHRYLDALTLAEHAGEVVGKLLLASSPQTALHGTLGSPSGWPGPGPGRWSRSSRPAGWPGHGERRVVTAVSAAIGEYLYGVDGTAVDVATMVPVNLRPAGTPLPRELGNCFALVLLELPPGRCRCCNGSARPSAGWTPSRPPRRRRSPSGPSRRSATPRPRWRACWWTTSPPRRFGVTTNVAGPAQVRYLAGTPISAILGWVPGSGEQSLGVCIYSYAGTVRVGFKADAGLVPDPEKLVHSFESALDDLLRVAAAVTASG